MEKQRKRKKKKGKKEENERKKKEKKRVKKRRKKRRPLESLLEPLGRLLGLAALDIPPLKAGQGGATCVSKIGFCNALCVVLYVFMCSRRLGHYVRSLELLHDHAPAVRLKTYFAVFNLTANLSKNPSQIFPLHVQNLAKLSPKLAQTLC